MERQAHLPPGGSFIVQSHNVLTPEGLAPAAVYVREGKIAGLGPRVEDAEEAGIYDVGRAALLPGVVDTHVHVNEPGRTEWEGFVSATRAAAAGGITTLVDMPLNSIPVTTNLAALRTKQEATAGQRFVDVGLWGGIVPGNAAELEGMIDAGALGFKCFLCHSGIDDFPESRVADLEVVMPILARRGIPLLVHAELLPPGHVEDTSATSRRYADYLASRPRDWEDRAIAMMIALCRSTGCAVHIVHLSSASALPMIAAARAEGLPFTVETCPHYLYFTAEEIPDGATWFKCAPPIREATNREALWEGLSAGVIDFVVCDHSPCTPGLKLMESGDFLHAWGGIASLQLSPRVVWTLARERGISVAQVWRWIAGRTAALAGLEGHKGDITPGRDADLVVWDLDARDVVQPGQLHHRHPISPYVGRALWGEVHTTWLRGEPIYHRGWHAPTPRGQLLSRSART